MAMSRRQFMRWEKLRLRGKGYFVARTTIVVAFASFVVINLGSWLLSGNPLPTAFFFLFPALGFVAGLLKWSFNEASFADFLENKRLAALPRKGRK